MVVSSDAKELIQALIKAKKNLRIYPENNPVYVKTVDDIYARITGFLDYTDPLTLKFKQYEILFDGDVVYHNEEKEESLALFFFKDGVRELTFKKGIPRDEVEEFLRVLSVDFEREALDDDIVTLMWEKDFHYIQYVVDDAFLIDDETYEETAVSQIKGSSADTEGILKAYEDAIGTERAAKINVVPLTNDDLRSIIQEIENDPPDKTLNLIQVLFEMFFYAEGKAEYDELSQFMKSTLEYAIGRGNLETAVYTIRKIRSSIKEGLYDSNINIYLRGVEQFVNSARFINLLGEVLDNGVEFTNDLLYEFAVLLDKNAIPHLIYILGELKNISARRATINILSVVGKKDISLLARGLNDGRWYVVRNVIYILRQIGERNAIEHLTTAVRHPDKRVRKEAIRALGEMGSGDVLHILKGCLSDPDESVRITTVRAVGLIRTPLSKKILVDEIAEKSFREKSFNEKKEFFEVLSRWKDGDVIDLLVKILRRRAFFKRMKNDETRAAAAYCLGLMGVVNAMDHLIRLQGSNNRLLRENVRAAIKRIKDGKSRG